MPRDGAHVVGGDLRVETCAQSPARVGFQRTADARTGGGQQHVGERHAQGVHAHRAAQFGNAQVAQAFDRRGVFQVQPQAFVLIEGEVAQIHGQSGNVKQGIVRQRPVHGIHAHGSLF